MIAIALAVIDSVCFAAAAVYQQRAVRETLPARQRHVGPSMRGTRLGVRSIRSLFRRRGWLAGLALMILGASVHVAALTLAPVSVIQPVGVLGVPFAVLLAARLDRRRPRPAAGVPIVICLLSVAGFVALTSRSVGAGAPTSATALFGVGVAMIVLISTVEVVGRRLRGWPRSLVYAAGGAIGVGMVSALMRGLIQLSAGDLTPLNDPRMLIMCVLLIGNGAVGGWMIQQAYASGSPEVVLACLTVIDPMIAVLVGLMLLGEGAGLGAGALAGMVLLGLLAMAGVCLLARLHPDVMHRTNQNLDRRVSPRPRLVLKGKS